MIELIELVQIALGKSDRLDSAWSASVWDEAYLQAKKQAVIGIVFKAIERLPEDQKPPKRIKVQWALACEKITDRNAQMNNHTLEFTKSISALGPKSCIIKGQGIASLYPWPEVRQSGDIDMWIEGNHKQVVPMLKQYWNVGKVFYHHAELDVFPDHICVEVHFRPTWMNNPFTNRELQKWFEKNATEQFANYKAELGFSMPTNAFNCVYCLLHIYRHLLSEGIGYRQLMDYYFVLLHSTREEREQAMRLFESLHMKKFAAAIMFVEQKLFLLDNDLLLCTPARKEGTLLLKEIAWSGNFGHWDARNKGMRDGNIFHRGFRQMCRLSRFISVAPEEVLWSPFFKLWQWGWRIIHHYL